MSVNDPIADMLTRIRNALMAHHQTVTMPSSRPKVEIAKILRQEGYIKDFDVIERQPATLLRVRLKYADGKEPVLTGLERVSKPGCRVYKGRDEIPWVLSGVGVAILSTNKGIMTGRQARRLGVGGEVLCYIW